MALAVIYGCSPSALKPTKSASTAKPMIVKTKPIAIKVKKRSQRSSASINADIQKKYYG